MMPHATPTSSCSARNATPATCRGLRRTPASRLNACAAATINAAEEARPAPTGTSLATATRAPAPAGVAGADRHGGAQRRRHRQHGTAVVVGVLTEQVDAPGRRRHDPGRHTEGR